MKQENIIAEKSFKFALRIVKLFLYLRERKIERDLCSQILNSGTSVGANIEEAIGGSSKKDFIHKLEIAYKEARETRYWLRLLRESALLETRLATSLIKDCEEILKILTAIINSSKDTHNS